MCVLFDTITNLIINNITNTLTKIDNVKRLVVTDNNSIANSTTSDIIVNQNLIFRIIHIMLLILAKMDNEFLHGISGSITYSIDNLEKLLTFNVGSNMLNYTIAYSSGNLHILEALLLFNQARVINNNVSYTGNDCYQRKLEQIRANICLATTY